MIIRQYQDVIDGRKTQTRRVIDPDKTILASEMTDGQRYYYSVDAPPFPAIDAILIREKNGGLRTRWQVGKVYAMVPKMGKPGVGFYRITSLRVERLQDINEWDAINEGIYAIPMSKVLRPTYTYHGAMGAGYSSAAMAYQALWQTVNGATKGARWRDNPYVAVIGIEYVGTVRP